MVAKRTKTVTIKTVKMVDDDYYYYLTNINTVLDVYTLYMRRYSS